MRFKQIFWQLALRKKPQGSILTDKNTPFLIVPNPKGMWAADPFIFEKDNRLFIFAELFSLKQWRGKIGYCVYENGFFSKWKIILDEDYHFSYPNVIFSNDNVYLMPETGSIGEVAFYSSENLNSVWKKEKILLKYGKTVDSIFLDEKRMLTYKMNGKNKNELILLCKDSDDSWQISDKRVDIDEVLRPGGAIFSSNDEIYRPAQDCRKMYGGALEFLKLNDNGNFLPTEISVCRLEPFDIKVKDFKKQIVGTHTYNSTNNFEIIDIQYWQFSVVGFFKRLILKINSKFGLQKHR